MREPTRRLEGEKVGDTLSKSRSYVVLEVLRATNKLQALLTNFKSI
jgi:hypothetical protein